MKQLLEQGSGLALTGIILAIGLTARFVLWAYYSMLGTACRKPETTKHKLISGIREELCQRLQDGIGMKSVTAYIECRLAECRVLNIRLGVWEGIAEQSVLLVMLFGILSAIGGALWECGNRLILAMLFLGEMSAVILLTMDLFSGIKEKRERTRCCIRDYIENCCFLEWDKQYGEGVLAYAAALAEPEEEQGRGRRRKRRALHNGMRETRQEKAARKRERRRREKLRKREEKARKRYLRSGKRMEKKECIREKKLMARRQKQCKAQLEKRRLTEELLRERRQMEAKQLAEQKSRERAEEIAPEQKTAGYAEENRKEKQEEAAGYITESAKEGAEERTAGYETVSRKERPEERTTGYAAAGEKEGMEERTAEYAAASVKEEPGERMTERTEERTGETALRQAETAIEQAQAEAAAADNSYEALLQDLLAEYLS